MLHEWLHLKVDIYGSLYTWCKHEYVQYNVIPICFNVGGLGWVST
jgi:hypothetical protein